MTLLELYNKIKNIRNQVTSINIPIKQNEIEVEINLDLCHDKNGLYVELEQEV